MNRIPGGNDAAAATPRKDTEPIPVPGTPLVASSVECPVCGGVSEQTSVPEGHYHVASREINLRPTAFVWRNKSHKNFHPPAYFVWQCPSCRYSACEEYFLHPTRDMVLSHRVFKRKVGEFLANPDNAAVLAALTASGGELEGSPLEIAIKRHLLAILILEQMACSDKINGGKLRVLVVDDNYTCMRSAEMLLRRLGVDVVAVSGAVDAVKSLEANACDLVFMDLMMPEIDGFEAVRMIRESKTIANSTVIPIIAVTANTMEDDREKCLAAGMDDFLAKPYTKTQLIDLVGRWSPGGRKIHGQTSL